MTVYVAANQKLTFNEKIDVDFIGKVFTDFSFTAFEEWSDRLSNLLVRKQVILINSGTSSFDLSKLVSRFPLFYFAKPQSNLESILKASFQIEKVTDLPALVIIDQGKPINTFKNIVSDDQIESYLSQVVSGKKLITLEAKEIIPTQLKSSEIVPAPLPPNLNSLIVRTVLITYSFTLSLVGLTYLGYILYQKHFKAFPKLE